MKIQGIKVYRIDELEPKVQEKIFYQEISEGFNWPWYDWVEDEVRRYLTFNGFEMDHMRFSGFFSQGDGANVGFTFKLTPEFITKLFTEPRPEPEKDFFSKRINPFWMEPDAQSKTMKILHEYLLTDKYVSENNDTLMNSVKYRIYQNPRARYQHSNTLEIEYDLDVDWNDPFWDQDVPDEKWTHGARCEAMVEALGDELLEWAKDFSNIVYRMLETEWEQITSEEAIRESLMEIGPNGDGYVYSRDGQYIGHLLIQEGVEILRGVEITE